MIVGVLDDRQVESQDSLGVSSGLHELLKHALYIESQFLQVSAQKRATVLACNSCTFQINFNICSAWMLLGSKLRFSGSLKLGVKLHSTRFTRKECIFNHGSRVEHVHDYFILAHRKIFRVLICLLRILRSS